MNMTLDVPPGVFTSAGGDGHSLTNTLWYVSSRPVTNPIPLPKSQDNQFDCGCPKTCTRAIQLADAHGSTCKSRIKWLVDNLGQSEYDACEQIALTEYPNECGGCSPNLCGASPTSAPVGVSSNSTDEQSPSSSKSPKCGCETTCNDAILNANADGYTCGARIDWLVQSMNMEELEACANVGGEEYKDICGGCDPKRCVNVADVPTKTNNPKKVEVDNGGCAPCSSAVCESDLNRCPPLNAPYLCYSGQNHGGCSPVPWDMDGSCTKCCKVSEGC